MTSTLLVLAMALVTLTHGTLVNRTADYGTEPIMIDRTTALSRTNSVGLEYLDNAYRNFLVHKRYIESHREKEGIDSSREEKGLPGSLQGGTLRRVKRAEEEQDPRCEKFLWESKDQTFITHPHNKDTGTTNYFSGINCVTVINGGEGTVVQLTFVDMFHIEYHPECDYDFLEIRDGEKGYAKILDKVCGEAFPRQITTSGPYVWLKFKSDDTIEYEGFKINIQFIPTSTSTLEGFTTKEVLVPHEEAVEVASNVVDAPVDEVLASDADVDTRDSTTGVALDKKCAAVGEFCMYHSECCTNACLGYLKKCVT